MEKQFNRVRSTRDIIVSLSIIAAGAILVGLPTPVSVNITGFFMIFAGLLLIFILQTGHKDSETGEYFKKKELFFPQNMKDRLMDGLKAENLSEIIKEENKGNGLRVDIFYRKSDERAYVRLYEYVPYKYLPATPFKEYSQNSIKALIG